MSVITKLRKEILMSSTLLPKITLWIKMNYLGQIKVLVRMPLPKNTQPCLIETWKILLTWLKL